MSKLTDHVRQLIRTTRENTLIPLNGAPTLDALIRDTEIIARNKFGENSVYMRRLNVIKNFSESEKFKKITQQPTVQSKGWLGKAGDILGKVSDVAQFYNERKQELIDILTFMLKEIELIEDGTL
jgi:hypothetical protein